MTITSHDIKLLASARMTDAADGGGPMTSTALQDGAENNVFPDISSVDRTFGRFALRKVYAADLADRAPAAERPTRAAAPAAPTSTVHTVRVDLGAGRQTSFNVASAADAAAAEAFIRQLEDAMRRANGGS